VERVHLEQDAGKSLHDQHPTMSFVDLNRSGVALMEIVSKPDMRSSEEARAYLTKLRTILRYLGTSDADMDKGNLRADINVSVRRPRRKASARAARSRTSTPSALPARRSNTRRGGRSGILEDWRARSIRNHGFSIGSGRDAVYALQGRRMTPAIFLTRTCCRWSSTSLLRSWRAACRTAGRNARFRAISACRPMMRVLVSDRESLYFETGARPRRQAGRQLVINELLGGSNRPAKHVPVAVSVHQLGELLDLQKRGVISGKIAKDVFEIMLAEGGDPRAIVESRGLKQVTDTGAIEKVVDEVIAANPDKVEQAKAKPTMLGWFVGQVMKSSGGKANPQAVNALLKARLGIE
jgi:aspartyl-tRNA(Asn)/glutamyl-tRNA(Gln) amidotransferase subunit B